MPPEEARQLISDYLRQAREYELNVEKLAAEGEFAKAGEALWGATTSALKALQLALRGRLLRAGEVRHFGRGVARELGAVEAFKAVHELHANFYDQRLDEAEFRLAAERGLFFLRRVADEVAAIAPATAP